MAGKTGYTPTPGVFDPQVHMDAIYAHFDPLIGESRANAAALPASGNWVGRTITAADSGVQWLCTALPGAWKPTNAGRRQAGATDSALQPILTQYGSGKLTGNGSTIMAGSVTFPTPFASLPVITASAAGIRTPVGAFADGGTTYSFDVAAVRAKTAAGFNIVLTIAGSNLLTNTDYYYDWIAVGEPA